MTNGPSHQCGDVHTPLTQEELTQIARRRGAEQERRKWRDAKARGTEAQAKAGNAALRQIVNPLMDMLADDLEAYEAGHAVQHGKALKLLRGAPIDEVCEAVARAAVSGMTAAWLPDITMQSKLGAAAEDAILEAHWRKLSPAQATAMRALLRRSSDAVRRRKARKAYARGWAHELLAHGAGWDERATKTVGLIFVGFLVRLGMFRRLPLAKKRGKRPTNGLELTEQARQWISNYAEHEAASAEVLYPTIDPPLPWTAPYGGGFHGRGDLDHPAVPRNRRPFWIVKSPRKEHKARLLNADLSTVYAALNAAQATPWRINGRVFEVFSELHRIGRGEAGLTPADKAEKPERMEEADTDSAARERFLAARRDYYEAERKAVAHRIKEHRVLDTAKLLRDSPRFHFVHALDFRGRAYACSTFLSPQGGDLERGLLEFAEGEPMGDDGEWWLKIHLANCYGLDKRSFAERIEWADAHREWFCQIAAAPLDSVSEWEEADQPWQFLAACFAWFDYYRHGEPLCRLPVSIDGSCSGIQHCAGLARDAEAGARVNLTPRSPDEAPADIYADVAHRTNELLAEAAERRDQIAYWWRYEWEVTRNDVKASVMTLPYGSNKWSNIDKVRGSVEKQIRKNKKPLPVWLSPDRDNRTARSIAYKVLANAVWQAMEEIIRVPMSMMKYAQACARAMHERERRQLGACLRFGWTSPCGFPVFVDYRKSKSRRTELKDEATGRALTFEYYALTDATDWREVAQSAPPHFIHSLDASHLIRVLAKAGGEADIRQVSVVHDAFGTTPGKVSALSRLLRSEFVAIYSGDVLGDTLGAMLDEAGAARPEPVQMGTLDLSAIREARYMFA